MDESSRSISAEVRVRSMKDGIYGSCAAQGWNCPNHRKKQTNANRIRSMSDEELAEFISKVNRTCIVDALGGDTQCDYEDVNCTECKAKFCGIQKWLQSEVE